MFIGHFALGFGAKVVTPRVSLGALFLAAQFIDLLWPTFLLFGIERVRIEPGATVVTPLVFEHYPYSHSLLAVLGWAVMLGVVYGLRKRDRGGAVMMGALVLSHWLLDLMVHRPDLPLSPWGDAVSGLHLWASLPLTLALEIPMFALGVWVYVRNTIALDEVGRWGLLGLVLFLFVIYAGNLFGPPPPNTQAIAWLGQLQWLLVLWGYWVDRHRRPLVPA